MFIRDLNNQLFREYRKWEGKYEDFDDELEGDMELDVTEEEEGDDGAQVFRAVLKKISGTIDQEDELLTLTGKGSSPPPQPIRDAIIMSLLYQNNVATSFWCNNDVFFITPRVYLVSNGNVLGQRALVGNGVGQSGARD